GNGVDIDLTAREHAGQHFRELMALHDRERLRGAARVEPIAPQLAGQGPGHTEKGRRRFDRQGFRGERHDSRQDREAGGGRQRNLPSSPPLLCPPPRRAAALVAARGTGSAGRIGEKTGELPKEDAGRKAAKASVVYQTVNTLRAICGGREHRSTYGCDL